MKREEFRTWVDRRFESKNDKYKKDIVCRAGRVEKAFQEIMVFPMKRNIKKMAEKVFLPDFAWVERI